MSIVYRDFEFISAYWAEDYLGEQNEVFTVRNLSNPDDPPYERSLVWIVVMIYSGDYNLFKGLWDALLTGDEEELTVWKLTYGT